MGTTDRRPDASAPDYERERHAEALEIERARLVEAFRKTPSFLAILRGPTHIFTLVNDAYYQLAGHRDVLNKPLLEALPEVRGQGFDLLMDRVLETGEPFIGRNVPVMLARNPGEPLEERFIDLAYLPLIEADGTRAGIIAHGYDVTDHIHARRELELLNQQLQDNATELEIVNQQLQENAIELEAQTDALDMANAALRASETRTRDVFTQAPIAIAVMVGPDHVYTIVSKQYAAMLGDRPLVGLTVREAVPELDQKIVATLDEVYNTGRAYRASERTLTLIDPHDGTSHDRVFNISYHPLLDGRGDVYAVASTAVEITLEVRARQEIEAAQIDAEHARQDAERARRAAELSETQAVTANQAKSAFLATMSHELRTPINAIQGYTQLIEMGLGGAVTDTQREYLNRLGTSAQHLLGVVNDVLDLSKVDAGEMTITRETGVIGEAISAALDLTMPQAAARNIRLVNDIPREGPHPNVTAPTGDAEQPAVIHYVGDAHRVRQVLLNLLSNAVKFTDAGGTVTITCGALSETPAETNLHGAGPWAFVRVTDTGIGIAPDQLTAVFEPFHQVEHGHTRTQGGTGLGLAISRRLARLMGGDLTLESQLGTGSTFTLWLPAARSIEISEDDSTSASTHETPAARSDRAQRGNGLSIRGLRELGEFLRAQIDQILDRYVDQLRSDPETPLARTMRRAELEDHVLSFVADLSQALIIIDGAGPSAAALLSDSSAIQRALAEAHGGRRYAQGWTESSLRRDYAVLRDAITRVVGDKTALTANLPRNQALDVLLGMIDRSADFSHRAWRRHFLEDTDRNLSSRLRTPSR